jgi:hypothetical protein
MTSLFHINLCRNLLARLAVTDNVKEGYVTDGPLGPVVCILLATSLKRPTAASVATATPTGVTTRPSVSPDPPYTR